MDPFQSDLILNKKKKKKCNKLYHSLLIHENTNLSLLCIFVLQI